VQQYYIVEFVRRVGFEPDERQAEVLRSGANRGILNCSRLWGKSGTLYDRDVVEAALSNDVLPL